MTYPTSGDTGVPAAYLQPLQWVANGAYQGGGYWAHYGGEGTHYTEPELERLYIDAGGAPLDAPVMAAIAEQIESGGWSDAWNSSGATGLWQIEWPGSAPPGMTREQLFSPEGNAQAAASLVASSQSYSAWGNDQWNIVAPPLDPSKTLPKGTTATLTSATSWNPLDWLGQLAQGATGAAVPGVNLPASATSSVTGTLTEIAVLAPVLLAAAAIAVLGLWRMTQPARDKARAASDDLEDRAGQAAQVAAVAA